MRFTQTVQALLCDIILPVSDALLISSAEELAQLGQSLQTLFNAWCLPCHTCKAAISGCQALLAMREVSQPLWITRADFVP